MSLVVPASVASVRTAVAAIGQPCALSGRTLAALRSWGEFVVPDRPDVVVPATRTDARADVATLRRVARWESLELVVGPHGIPSLGVVDGIITLAPHCDDATLHTLIQRLAFEGALDVRELMRRRRTGLPGSARITRVGQRYLIGLDSPRELEVFNVLRSRQLAPDHLNVELATADGRVVGPFDGYADVGAAYDVDSIFHTADDRVDRDLWKTGAASAIGLAVVRFIGFEITSRRPMIEGWVAAREDASARGAGVGIEVRHLPGRSCVCGHVAA